MTLTATLHTHAAGERAAHLQHALQDRVLVERGTGFLMATDSLDAVTAFNT